MKKLAILGASGHGKVVADIAESIGYSVISFFDDSWPNIKVNFNRPVEGTLNDLIQRLSEFDQVIVAIGDNKIRLQKLDHLIKNGGVIAKLIHPSAIISKTSSVGAGTVVMPNVVINADSEIGEGCIINTCAVIEHDCKLGKGVHISPNAALAGNVIVNGLSWIGINASVKQGVSIGENCVIGAGSVVIRDILNNQIMAGVPAKEIRKNNLC